MGTPLLIRVGGDFVYPPRDLSEGEPKQFQRLVFVAGGVGINPIMSMLEYLHLEGQLESGRIHNLRLLYGTRAREGEAILFYERLVHILGGDVHAQSQAAVEHGPRATLYLTGETPWSPSQVPGHESLGPGGLEHRHRRIRPADLLEALGPVDGRKTTLAYVCGPPKLTDEFVEVLSRAEGMDSQRVLCEKWW